MTKLSCVGLVLGCALWASAAAPAQIDPAAAREDAKRALGGGRVIGDQEQASRDAWPGYERDIDKALAEQDRARAAGEKESQVALSVYEARAQAKPGPVECYLYGRLLGVTDQIDRAREQFERSLKADPFFPWAFNGLATCFQKQGRLEDATRNYQHVLDLKPDFLRAMQPLAACLIAAGPTRYAEAEALLKKAAQLQPQSVEVTATIGQLALNRARYGEAVVAFKRVLELVPGNEAATRMLASALGYNEQLPEAITVYTGLLAQHPDDFIVLKELGKANQRLGQNHVAADWYEKALKLWPDGSAGDPNALLNQINLLRAGPATEKVDPKRKTPHEWAEVLLHSTEPERRLEAMRQLTAYPVFDEEVHVALLRAAKDQDKAIRTLAIRQIGARRELFGSDITPLVRLFVDDKEASVRNYAVYVLGTSDEPRAIPVLMGVLATKDVSTFRQVYDGLCRLAPRLVDPMLPEALDAAKMDELRKGWRDWYAENRDRYKKFETAPK